MATIRDVAKMAGVSTATVSRILNSDKTYKSSKETQDKVWNAVRALDYVPNQAAKHLSNYNDRGNSFAKDKMKIGCIMCITCEKYSDPYFMAILSGAESKLIENGYSLSVIRTQYELQEPTVLFNTLNEPLTGLIVMETLNDDIYKVIRDKVEFIVGIDTLHKDIDNICYDHFEAAENAVSYLIGKGHRRIAYLGGTDTEGGVRKEKRYKGYLSALEDVGIGEDLNLVKNCRWDSQLCHSQTLELIETENRPTAIFAASDLMAMVAIKAIFSSNLKVPDDIAVIGLSNIDMSEYTNPALSTIDIPKMQMGEIAAEMLISRIKGDVSLPRMVILPTRLIERSST